MEFIESSIFVKLIDTFLNDEQRRALQNFLVNNPNGGAVIRGGGGARKLRWKLPGHGKSGGLRVIYIHSPIKNQIAMVLVYPKSEKSDLTKAEIKLIALEAKSWR